jgi:hypothetical protein
VPQNGACGERHPPAHHHLVRGCGGWCRSSQLRVRYLLRHLCPTSCREEEKDGCRGAGRRPADQVRSGDRWASEPAAHARCAASCPTSPREPMRHGAVSVDKPRRPRAGRRGSSLLMRCASRAVGGVSFRVFGKPRKDVKAVNTFFPRPKMMSVRLTSFSRAPGHALVEVDVAEKSHKRLYSPYILFPAPRSMPAQLNRKRKGREPRHN